MGEIYCDREKDHQASARRAKEGVLSSSDVEKICKTFQLLSDPGRLKIVLALMQGEMCVYHLVEACGGTQSGISHQLRILRDNGIVRCKRMGKHIEYAIADEHVYEIVNTGRRHLQCSVEVEE